MEWCFYGPLLLAVVMFLLVGTIFEKRIELAVRSYFEHRRTQFLHPANRRSTEPYSTTTEATDPITPDAQGLNTPDFPNLKSAATFLIPPKMPDAPDLKEPEAPDLKATGQKTPEENSGLTPTASTQAVPLKTKSLPTVSEIGLTDGTCPNNTTSKKNLLIISCKSAAILATLSRELGSPERRKEKVKKSTN